MNGGSPELAATGEAWFRTEVLPHEPALRAWLRGSYPSLVDVDDVIQESYLRLWRARETTSIQNARTFLFGIARHVAFESFRKRRIFADVPVNEMPDSPTIQSNADVVATVSRNQEVALVSETIKALPDRCREIVLLRTQEGLSYGEIAEKLGLAEETVRVQMARGIKKCAHLLREQGVTAGNGTVKTLVLAPRISPS
jgi:RNA polymerase sigma-70 factor (ECF subfamily)